MKKLWLLAVFITPLQLIHAQQVKHAPTVEQCRADQKLWLSKLEQQPVSVGVANVSYQELNGWESEMVDCSTVDPSFQMPYLNTMAEIEATNKMRLQKFLVRHNSYGQFLAEDAQGQGR